jgi:hypothetical protein
LLILIRVYRRSDRKKDLPPEKLNSPDGLVNGVSDHKPDMDNMPCGHCKGCSYHCDSTDRPVKSYPLVHK